MLNIEIDGVYCKECNCLHPILFWRELYDDYLKTKDDAILYYKNVAVRFGENISDKEAIDLYYENMRIKGLEYSEKSGDCLICKNKTHYILIKINKFVCSDKCKYQAE